MRSGQQSMTRDTGTVIVDLAIGFFERSVRFGLRL
jgi:hypothetical protein